MQTLSDVDRQYKEMLKKYKKEVWRSLYLIDYLPKNIRLSSIVVRKFHFYYICTTRNNIIQL